jgi:nucleotide-binding universal stress UspA family protein
MFKHILVPTDGSRLSEEAAGAAIRMAKSLGARITALHVVPKPVGGGLDAWTHADAQFEAHLGKSLEARGYQYLANIKDLARRAGVPCECALVRGESPHGEIVVEARSRGCDLIVMASHGRSGDAGLLLASETIKVMTLGDVPVLVHRSRAARQASAAG